MKNKEEEELKNFDSVEFFRKVKEQIAKEFAGESFKEQKEIIKKILYGEIKRKPVR